ncbi:hypothetical protein [Blastococcus saxobsidens]|uniref:Uncharacterized protein n=1 Tax=Blastococcus saxobsidens TaxID=138336 RepID=A0A4Q7Y700_9ACTN|nr:hypothetical protein [Blastococcus saxobsidens]RZU32710.1 hypothetical protein BKA19_2412 [Blastococcus saxobsidens]
MTWSKFSDDFSDDCWTLSDRAFRLHVEGLVWNGRKLLDLHIPKDELRRFAKHPDAVDELLAVGWWSEDGDVYVIRHHGDYQRTREQVLAQQSANASNGKKGGRPRKVPREITEMPSSPSETQSVSQSVFDSSTHRGSDGRGSDGGAAETHAQKTHSLSESRTERDRTGQDRTGSYGSSGDDTWPSVVCTTSGHGGCGWQVVTECPDCCALVAR